MTIRMTVYGRTRTHKPPREMACDEAIQGHYFDNSIVRVCVKEGVSSR